ncbi:YqeG family HAD IIIA-type phosphatase [Mycoplasmoides alvi]|uniref:YqeG family HAD IIIA-type phosphatase n=1 Tax=Mycoplasmoides alvi TaxID=78580 RepID=UPI00051B9FE7|nr:HAD-IIIA family hydrolase [Mycoplasmoides alvi]
MKSQNNSFLNYFRPSMYINSFEKINIFSLVNQNIGTIYCDLDNTLVPHFSRKPNNNVKQFLKKVKNEKIHIWILSNNSKKRVFEFCKELIDEHIIDGYISNAKKPLVYKVKKHMKKNQILPEETIIIGDKLLIDILLANRLGCKSILVHPLLEVIYDLKTNNKKIQKFIENIIYLKLEKNNFLNINSLNQEFIDGANEIL